MTAGSRPVALVTGGSRGIGAAIVRKLAGDGYDVAFCYRSAPEAAERVAKTAASAGSRTLTGQVDVTDAGAVRGFVAQTESALGPIVMLVSCAGITRDQNLVTMAEEDWSAVLDVNLTGTFQVCRAVVFSMMKRRRGSIVAISSVAGVYGNAGQTNYSASKAGIIGFTKSLAKETGRYGIRVNAVTPGFITTDMTEGMSQNALKQQIPLGRWGEAGEVAELVAFLGSDRAGYITGGVFPIDGGIRL